MCLQLIDNGHGYNGSLELLLDCGGNLNMANNFGHTPLHLAAHHGDAETSSFLVFKGAFVHAMDRVSLNIMPLCLLDIHHAYVVILSGWQDTLTLGCSNRSGGSDC